MENPLSDRQVFQAIPHITHPIHKNNRQINENQILASFSFLMNQHIVPYTNQNSSENGFNFCGILIEITIEYIEII